MFLLTSIKIHLLDLTLSLDRKLPEYYGQIHTSRNSSVNWNDTLTLDDEVSMFEFDDQLQVDENSKPLDSRHTGKEIESSPIDSSDRLQSMFLSGQTLSLDRKLPETRYTLDNELRMFTVEAQLQTDENVKLPGSTYTGTEIESIDLSGYSAPVEICSLESYNTNNSKGQFSSSTNSKDDEKLLQGMFVAENGKKKFYCKIQFSII